jgi:hypothetical protein
MLYITLIMLNFFDSLYTYFGIKNKYIYEANPLMNYSINRFGLEFTLYCKMVFVIFCVYMIKKIGDSKSNYYALIFCNLFYLFIVISHMYLHHLWCIGFKYN